MTIESQCRSKETELTALDGIQIYSNEYDTASYLIDAISDYHQITSRPLINQARIPHLAQTSDAVNRQLSGYSSRYMNLLAVFQI